MLPSDYWEFNILGIYDYKSSGPLFDWYEVVKNNINKVDGELVEAGVFKGRSYLATSLLIKEMKIEKKLTRDIINYGFDSFAGFPPVDAPQDQWNNFESQHKRGLISDLHFENVNRNWQILKVLKNLEVPKSSNLSTSGDFSNNSLNLLNRKIDLLNLKESTKLVDGPFSVTMINSNLPEKIAGVLFDCDLYESYKVTLHKTWPRLTTGGWLYFDEYYSLKFPGARTAVDEFFIDKLDQIEWHRTRRDRDFERNWIIKK
jgi:hypothetical protein